jgi:twitching motility protein PilT
MEIFYLLSKMLEKKASDLHIRLMSPPVLRVDGKLWIQDDMPNITLEKINQIIGTIATPEQVQEFIQHKELDFAYSVPGIARFRVNVMMQRGSPSIAFRLVPIIIPTIDELGLPQILKSLILKPRGLILVTGPTGSGKSTTLAAMIDYLNDQESRNVITIEEPVEFLHQNRKSIIVQRDVGNDTESFSIALCHALRHDPDVIVVGEMRDLATISTAITAAETGHLVLATLHTYNAPQSIDRMIDIFPSEQQQQVKTQLSQVLEAVISQTLVTRFEGGRVAAFEIMVASSAVRNLIRENKLHQLLSLIETSTKDGMKSLDQSLADLVKRQIISRETAMTKVINYESFENWMKSPLLRIDDNHRSYNPNSFKQPQAVKVAA